jgi:hypothetical protein
MIDFDFPVLDNPPIRSTDKLGPCIFDSSGSVDAYLEETDDWVSMPVRLVHDQAAGWKIECGPCDFDRCDIEMLRSAIAAYDQARSAEVTPPGRPSGELPRTPSGNTQKRQAQSAHSPPRTDALIASDDQRTPGPRRITAVQNGTPGG